MVPQIPEFCFDQEPWRIDCLGGIFYPDTPHREPLIEVYFSGLCPIQSEKENPLLNGSLLKPPRHKVATVKSGVISLLKMGSVWREGIARPPGKPLRTKDFVLHADQLSFVRFDGAIAIDGVAQKPLAQERYQLGELASKRASGAWLAIAHNPIPGVAILAIPCTSLFQKCAATSSKAVSRLLLGEIETIIDPSLAFLKHEPGTLYVEMFKDFADSEAKAIANLMVDPQGKFEYERLRRALAVQSANSDANLVRRSPAAHIKFGLPFSNPVAMKTQGKPIKFAFQKGGKTVEEWGFLVTEITSLTAQLVFEKIVIGRKNDSSKGQNSDDADLREFSVPLRAQITLDGSVLPIDSSLEPSRNLEAICLEAGGNFEAKDLVVEGRLKEVQRYKSLPRFRAGSEFSGAGSTGDPHGSDTGNIEVNIDPKEPPRVPVTLAEFFKALTLLRTKGLEFRTIATSPSSWTRPEDGMVMNYWPRFIQPRLSWHLMGKGKDSAVRKYVVAELKRGGTWHYLIEIERKGPPLSLQHVRSADGSAIDKRELHRFMVRVAIENGWSAKDFYRHWVFSRVIHPSSDRAEGLAKAIAQLL